jgi:hypothetical protein
VRIEPPENNLFLEDTLPLFSGSGAGESGGEQSGGRAGTRGTGLFGRLLNDRCFRGALSSARSFGEVMLNAAAFNEDCEAAFFNPLPLKLRSPWTGDRLDDEGSSCMAGEYRREWFRKVVKGATGE